MPLLVTEADRLNGIDQKLSYGFRCDAHRKFEPGKGWSEWKPGKPVLFSGIQLQRKNKKWEVTGSPEKYYAAR